MRRFIAALGLLISACYSSSEGISPPLDRVYFPVGLTTDCDRHYEPGCTSNYLYVASSDFDLQYKSGTIQAIRLDGVRHLVEQVVTLEASSCQGPVLEPQSDADGMMYPGPCKPIELNRDPDGNGPLIPSKPNAMFAVGTGAFATDIVLRYGPEPQSKKRLLVPVRGESSLHWINLALDGSLECGATERSPNCTRKHRVGTDPSENERELKMPSEPYGIATSDAGDAIVITHQTRGEVTLFRQDLQHWDDGPKLEYVHLLPALGAVAVASAPESQYVRERRKQWLASQRTDDAQSSGPDPFPPGFLIAYRNAARIDLVRLFADAGSSPTRPFLETVQGIPLRANSQDIDSRGVLYEDSARSEFESSCAAIEDSMEREQCLKHAASMPVGAYVTSRTPASLLVGTAEPALNESLVESRPAFSDMPNKDVPRFDDVVPLPVGVSRIYAGKVVNEAGELETRLFAVCYDQRQIAIYDPRRKHVETYVRTGRGPHAMAFDFDQVGSSVEGNESHGRTTHALAYVGHFLDSYLGVIQLDRRNIRTYGTIVLSLAQPVAPRAKK